MKNMVATPKVSKDRHLSKDIIFDGLAMHRVQDRSGAGHSATIGGVSDHSKSFASVGENYWQRFRERPGMGAQGA